MRRRLGTKVSSVSTLEKKRVRQTDPYSSPWSPATTAASAKEEMNGAARPAPTMKTVTPRRVLRSTRSPLIRRTVPAAINASKEFVKNNATIMGAGQEVSSSTTTCAGKAASR